MTEAADETRLAAVWLEDVRGRFEQALSARLAEKRARVTRLSPDTAPLVEAVQDLSTRGGKRLRPALLVAGYHVIEPGAELGPAIEVGIAVELLQTYLLIQDDWMDRDETRRGAKTIHIKLAERYGDAHLGAAAAILASDLASAYAWDALARAPFPDGRVRAALSVFEEIQEEVVLGQLLDMTGQGSVDTMHLLKTAGYTVRGPIKIGAILAGATPAALEALDRFALPLGLAFQLRDDLLGTFGDPKVTGKPAGNDLRAGKRTALLAEARATLGGADTALLDRVAGNANATDEDLAALSRTLASSGVVARVESRLDAHLTAALTALESAPIAAPGKALLRGTARMLADRRR